MSDLVFDDIKDLDGDPDTTPPLDAPEYPCEKCGKEAGPYGGRGRKPRFCAEHKKSGPSTSSGKPKSTGKNLVLAAQAADTLAQYNDLVGLVARLADWELTAEQIDNANPVFKEKAYAALITDPDLAASIVRTGGISGKAALIISYGMFAASVAPVAMLEAKVKRKAKLDAAEDV